MTAPAAGLRLFVALDLPSPVREALARFRDVAVDAALWRPLPDASFHVTLAFLGARPQADVVKITEVLRRLEPWSAPQLALGEALLLPSRAARVLTVAVRDPEGALRTLQTRVSSGLAAAQVFTPQARSFRPHVTVARLRSGARPPRTLRIEPESLPFQAGAVTLYRSVLGRGGAIYEPLFARHG